MSEDESDSAESFSSALSDYSAPSSSSASSSRSSASSSTSSSSSREPAEEGHQPDAAPELAPEVEEVPREVLPAPVAVPGSRNEFAQFFETNKEKVWESAEQLTSVVQKLAKKHGFVVVVRKAKRDRTGYLRCNRAGASKEATSKTIKCGCQW